MPDEDMPDATTADGEEAKDAFASGIAKGNINLPTSKGPAETIQLTDDSRQSRERQEALLAQVELRRRMKEVVVPTNDAEVRRMLRTLAEPVTLFGERELERRERLRKLLATNEEAAEKLAAPTEIEIGEELLGHTEVFYTEGSEALRAVRLKLARESLLAAAARVGAAKRKREDPHEDEEAEEQEVAVMMKSTVQQSSEIGGDRPISGCAFSPDGSCLATCGWGGDLRLWSLPSCECMLTVSAHDVRATGLSWHPHAHLGRAAEALCLATGGADGSAKLWSGQGKCLGTLTGHTDRLGRVAFHPFGQLLGTASFDQTWRLWDCETGVCVMEQEGHSRAVYAVAFQCDGSLAASVGLDAVGRIWDLRTGRNIHTLQGHVKGVLAVDFSPNGYMLATGSDDNTARVWNLRKKACVYTLPGHNSLLAQVRFEPLDGHYLLTCGYDNTSKLWSAGSFTLLKTLAGHEGKVMGGDIAPDGSGLVATVSYDRTIKLWAPESQEE